MGSSPHSIRWRVYPAALRLMASDTAYTGEAEMFGSCMKCGCVMKSPALPGRRCWRDPVENDGWPVWLQARAGLLGARCGSFLKVDKGWRRRRMGSA
jgi:hypothetical protein